MGMWRRWTFIVVLGIIGNRSSGDDWAGWRGSAGGVSFESDLPSTWSPGNNIRWKSKIPGEGISAPSVWGDQIFLTTAYESEPATAYRAKIVVVLATVVVLGILWLVLGYQRSRRHATATGVSTISGGWTSIIEFAGITGASVIFLLGFSIVALDPEIVIPAGDEARAWLVSGLISAAGLIAGVGWLRGTKRMHVVGAILLLAGAGLFFFHSPLDLFNRPMPFHKLLVIVGPLAVTGLWYLARAASLRKGGAGARPAYWAPMGGIAWIASSILLFVLVNYLGPSTGLVRAVICLNRNTGHEEWRTAAYTADRERKYRSNSYATPTAVTDGQLVVAYFGPVLACLDVEGNVKWTKTVPKYFDYCRYGAAISPLMFEDLVIYAYWPEWPGGEDKQYREHGFLEAVNKHTGEVAWRARPPGAHDSYSTPLITNINSRSALVVVTWLYVVAIDVRDGTEIWRCEIPLEQGVPTPVADSDAVYVFGGTHGPKAGLAIRLNGSGDVTASNVLWKVSKKIPECASPVLYNGLVYVVTEMGILSCIEASSGKVVWTERVEGHFVGSLVAGDGKIYLMSDSGETTVISAAREFDLISRNAIGEESNSSPVISNADILIRGAEHLFCIGRG
jgi:outer membrane protein assembly factor BamB